MAERFNAAVLKTVDHASGPGVRIPHSPPLNQRSSVSNRLLSMRLSPQQANIIRRVAREILGSETQITLFGSRARDDQRGGDLDLLVEIDTPVDHPALLCATMSARLSRAFDGRRIDVVLKAPNLAPHPIHTIAQATGTLL